MSFTTVDGVKAFLNKATLTVDQTALVQMLIGLVDGVICSYCGWTMLAKDYPAKKYDGNGQSEMDLGVYPINALTQVLVYDDLTYATFTDQTDNVVHVDEEGILIFKDSGTTFTSGRLNVAVTFNAGFNDTNMPSELTYAANYLVALEFNRIDAESIGVASEKFNQVEVEYQGTDIPQLVKRVLDRYRAVHIF